MAQITQKPTVTLDLNFSVTEAEARALDALIVNNRGAKIMDFLDAVGDVLLFSVGVAASFAVHELSHEIAARAYHEELVWTDSRWICQYPCKNVSQVAVAGNLGTAIFGEAMLLLPAKYKHTPFVDGIQAFNAANPIGYYYHDSQTPGGYGDYAYVDDRVEFVLAAHAVTLWHRQFSSRLWSLRPKHGGVELQINF